MLTAWVMVVVAARAVSLFSDISLCLVLDAAMMRSWP